MNEINSNLTFSNCGVGEQENHKNYKNKRMDFALRFKNK